MQVARGVIVAVMAAVIGVGSWQVVTLHHDNSRLARDVSTLQSQLATAEGGSGSLSAQVTRLQGEVTSLTGQVSQLSHGSDVLVSTVACLRSAIDDSSNFRVIC
jgi:cell division protein FtsB